eukprot:COSAG01_NODE_5958_length_3934_cov_14.281356_2_plen_339_part_00
MRPDNMPPPRFQVTFKKQGPLGITWAMRDGDGDGVRARSTTHTAAPESIAHLRSARPVLVLCLLLSVEHVLHQILDMSIETIKPGTQADKMKTLRTGMMLVEVEYGKGKHRVYKNLAADEAGSREMITMIKNAPRPLILTLQAPSAAEPSEMGATQAAAKGSNPAAADDSLHMGAPDSPLTRELNGRKEQLEARYDRSGAAPVPTASLSGIWCAVGDDEDGPGVEEMLKLDVGADGTVSSQPPIQRHHFASLCTAWLRFSCPIVDARVYARCVRGGRRHAKQVCFGGCWRQVDGAVDDGDGIFSAADGTLDDGDCRIEGGHFAARTGLLTFRQVCDMF